MNLRIEKILFTAVSGVMVLLLAVILAAPYWLGQKAEKNHVAMLVRLSGSGDFSLVGKNYQRGWLSSSAVTSISHPKLPFDLIARTKIEHGPFPLNRILQGAWQFTPVQAHISSQIYFTAPGTEGVLSATPLSAEIIVRLNGDGRAHVSYPSIKKAEVSGLTLDGSGVFGEMNFDREWKKIRVELRIPSLTLTAPAAQGDLVMSKLSFVSDMEQGTTGHFFGEGTLAVDRLEFGKAGKRVNLQGLEIYSAARPESKNVNLVFHYKLDAVGITPESFGPGMLAIEVRHLDMASLTQFTNELDVISQRNLPESQASQLVAGKTLAFIGALAKNAPELEITRLSFKTEEGEISGKAKFVLDGSRRSPAPNPMQLLTMLSGDLELVIAEPVLKRLLTPAIKRDIEAHRLHGSLSARDLAKLDAQSMAAIVDKVFPRYLAQNEFTRLLLEEKGLYKMSLSIHKGELLFNGKPWHLPNRMMLPQ